MGGRFFDWTPDDSPGFSLSTASNDGWEVLRSSYCLNNKNKAFDRVVEIAQEHGVRCVIVERRYIDIDYRSEHSHFYSTTFLRYPSVCHRLHFFVEEITDLADLEAKRDTYRGYSVMRPIPSAPVGRTMISPPPSIANEVLCEAEDTVHLWGCSLPISAMPFVSQDAQYLRCAHSALWMVLYHAHLRHGLPRRLPHDIHEAAIGGHVIGRQVPSEGLTVGQVINALHQLNMSGGPITLPEDRGLSRAVDPHLSLFGILCRYVNSNMPPMVYSRSHAWVVVGYRKIKPGHGHDAITLYRHDDAAGPYLEVTSPFEDEGEQEPYVPWRAAIPPLPQKVYMTGERAELVGGFQVRNRARQLGEGHVVSRAIAEDRMTLRTYAVRSTEFKEAVTGRLDRSLSSLYRLTHMPRWIWVVEALDRTRLDEGSNPVIGEIIIDATASDVGSFDDPVVIAIHLAGDATIFTPDHGKVHHLEFEDFEPYATGIAAVPLVEKGEG